ncbi:uncharacterized protein LOC130993882 [Salvia miltiorrhiza]|uniref:uncharacterized protein LOC130993882 n=1 Tax=Salvia miltiorrhiza TaxID=226208 RepID=UPI0025AC995E|nr:uncharacterized protein LOC130993882 [Salvia miltiorrhiza]
METFSDVFGNSWWGFNNTDKAIRNSEGRAGGIVCLWNREVFEASSSWDLPGAVVVNGRYKKDGLLCCIINVYAPTESKEKRILWDAIGSIVEQNADRSVCILGDFNAVRRREERVGSGETFRASDARFFEDFIRGNDLKEIHTQGRKYTWYKPNGKCKSKIDRFLVNETWMLTWEGSSARGLQRSISDHCPIVLTTRTEDWGPRPFRFLNAWTNHPEFEDVVKKVWTGTDCQGWSFFVVKEKLKKLREALKVWNRTSFGEIDSKIHELKKELQQKDELDEQSCLGEVDVIRRNELQALISLQMKHKQMTLQQKAKLKWLKEGDVNSGFFHKAIKGRRLKNDIGGLIFDNSWISKPEEVKARVRNHFETFFKRKDRQMPVIPIDFVRRKISDEERNWLIRGFEPEEVKEAVWSCSGDKSPGPDGFNFSFWRSAWHVVKEDILQVLKDFHANGKIPKGGRFILDGAVILNEVVVESKKKRRSRIFFKIDFAKAFDSVQWDFLDTLLDRMNFDGIWRKWIQGCLQSATASVLVNGSSTGDFKMERGLRQGDPMSPFLFLIVAEGLNALVERAVERQLLFPVKIGKDEVPITHLQYADDTIFILEADERNVESLISLLLLFHFVSGLAVNFAKSSLMTVGVNVLVERTWASFLHCKIGYFPCLYLGTKIGGRSNGVSEWKFLVDKVSNKIASWRKRPLSLAGRITLVKAVLQSIPVYQLAYAFIPKTVLKNLNSLFSRFLWGGDSQSRRITWFKWSSLCSNKKTGGLGFLVDGGALWARVIKSIYGELVWGEEGDCSMVGRSGQLGWWAKIVEKGGGRDDRWFIDHLQHSLGDGMNTMFWEDVWAVNKPLKFSFPRLYNLCSNKKALVGESGFWEGEEWVWSVNWRRDLRERENGQVEELLRLVAAFVPSTDD